MATKNVHSPFQSQRKTLQLWKILIKQGTGGRGVTNKQDVPWFVSLPSLQWPISRCLWLWQPIRKTPENFTILLQACRGSSPKSTMQTFPNQHLLISTRTATSPVEKKIQDTRSTENELCQENQWVRTKKQARGLLCRIHAPILSDIQKGFSLP